MAENSAIEWTDHTFNPWIGCTKVSDGCKHCYAETLMDKRYHKVQWGVSGKRIRTSAHNWNEPLRWNRKAEKEGKRARAFCASLADVFEDKKDQPEMDEWRADLFDLIKQTPSLDWLLLTKRPQNVRKAWHWELMGYPDNVWIGTSVENQEQADKRIPELLKIPAAVRFLSMEPLLGPVDLRVPTCAFCGLHGEIDTLEGLIDCPNCGLKQGVSLCVPPVHWVIVGGESGANARPMHPDWVRSIRDQCVDAGVPFFFKQWGEWAWTGDYITGNNLYAEKQRYIFADRTVMLKVGKHAAGRLLDGREWNEFPALSTNIKEVMTDIK